MESIVAAASAGTLGYIWRNEYGAYKAIKNMAPLRYNKRKRPTSYYGKSAMRKRAKGAPSTQGRYVKKRQSNNYTTKQYDVTTQYRKRSMPRFKKKAWGRFVRRVTAVGIKNAGLKTVIFNNRLVSTSSAGYQGVFSVCLYGVNGTDVANSTLGYRDLFAVFNNEPAIVKTAAPGSVPLNGVLNFGSGILDITLRNLGEQDAEVDVYYGYHWKDTTLTNPRNGSNTRNLIEDFTNGGYNQEIAAGNSTINLGERGATPFDLSSGLSSSGFKVLKKQKILMEPGKSVFIQHKDPKNHRLDWVNLNKGGYAKKGLTYDIMVIHKPAVSSTDDLQSTLAVGVTRKFSYTVLDWNQDENAKL